MKAILMWRSCIAIMQAFSSVPKDKKALRRYFLENRNSMTIQEVTGKSQAIYERVLSLQVFQEAEYPFIYFSMGNEVQTERLIRSCIEMGKYVSIPVTLVEERRMVAAHIMDVDDLVETGKYRIREPRVGTYELVEPISIDLVIAPGIAFDAMGRRIGYGGGYYDRFLLLVRASTPVVGLAYESQIVYDIPVEQHDMSVDIIVSEKRIIDCEVDGRELL
jgi:5-formyltetrahydrofolate cyclo-ligase